MILILYYFILGIVFYVAIIPVIESFGGLLAQALEVLKGHLLVSLTKSQVKIKALKSEDKDCRMIGFTIPSGTEEEEQSDDDE